VSWANITKGLAKLERGAGGYPYRPETCPGHTIGRFHLAGSGPLPGPEDVPPCPRCGKRIVVVEELVIVGNGESPP
jgi:hypothetical protein